MEPEDQCRRRAAGTVVMFLVNLLTNITAEITSLALIGWGVGIAVHDSSFGCPDRGAAPQLERSSQTHQSEGA